ncbi:MAG: hypothetical protein KGJ23_15640 [Euryarchaeota archaeon]|nr:hypothetical protein [Euryarchaeota archaeon]MDE1838032.1 hypothetical protein [Euryarchaeota archaeon]MDE2045049.1 hypothetical protein [Thermoplasmata archaeon]
MATKDPLSSIPAHASTIRFLQQMKTGSQNWDQFLLDMAERIEDLQDVVEGLRAREALLSGAARTVPFDKFRARVLAGRR